jgi:predicted RNA-binding Zn-ribbon protein involved in translation (DUF1610 family)
MQSATKRGISNTVCQGQFERARQYLNLYVFLIIFDMLKRTRQLYHIYFCWAVRGLWKVNIFHIHFCVILKERGNSICIPYNILSVVVWFGDQQTNCSARNEWTNLANRTTRQMFACASCGKVLIRWKRILVRIKYNGLYDLYEPYQLAFLTMTNIRHFWVASNSR